MSRSAVCIALVLLSPLVVLALEHEEYFDLPDGTVPFGWVSTGAPDDMGTFSVQSGAFVHDSVGTSHYYYDWCPNGIGYYTFLVEGSGWEFAWRISMADPSSGRCLTLSHGEREGQWEYTFTEFAWQVPDAPSGRDTEYSWHLGTPLRTVSVPTPGPLLGWHLIDILDLDPAGPPRVEIRADWELLFQEEYAPIAEGYQGFGCSTEPSLTPALDDFIIGWPDPVERSSWGSVKGRFLHE